jgi:site-specific DNA recombinase
MPVPKFFKTEFNALATNDAIGHPNGELAYGYLRVSSAGQADEGRSGLPRQIMHVHEVALNNGLKIPWENLYADDDSGFDFADRPDLSRLRQDYKSPNRKAKAVVMEHLDRLSRNADWHQGYLLDEMKQFGLHAVFWKQFTSRIERAVMGAIAQDGMEQAKQRMAEGNIHKAKDGRVTARVPAYGYKLVDSFGREGETAKKDTHYAIREDEAQVVRYIFQKIIEGYPSRRIAILLEGSFPPPKKFANWESKMVRLIIKNRVYKGEFIAHNIREVKIPVSSNPMSLTETAGMTVVRRVQRPPEEWIIVPVPAIMTIEEWDMANKMLEKNSQMSKRHGKFQYLLTGLVKCATCNYSFIGGHRILKKTLKKSNETKEYLSQWYMCTSTGRRMPVIKKKIGCNQSQIASHILENAVWSVVCEVLLHPDILLDALEREFNGDANEQTNKQISFLESQIKESKIEDEKLYKAYLASVFDEVEYAERRKLLKESKQRFSDEINRLRGNLMTMDQYEERKREILLICRSAIKSGLAMDAPFEVKQHVLKTIVDKITLNVNEGWFELEGVIRGQYLLFNNNENGAESGPDDGNDEFDAIGGNPKDTDSLPLSTENWPETSASLAPG